MKQERILNLILALAVLVLAYEVVSRKSKSVPEEKVPAIPVVQPIAPPVSAPVTPITPVASAPAKTEPVVVVEEKPTATLVVPEKTESADALTVTPAPPIAPAPVTRTIDEDREAVLKNIFSRKSVRSYLPGRKAIDKEQLTGFIRAGMAAPTARNAQPWSFVAITDPAVLDRLSGVLSTGLMLKKASAAIVVCGEGTTFLAGESRNNWMIDCAAATENILLAIENAGLGGVWIGVTPYAQRVAQVSEVLSLKKTTIPFAIISIGYPDGTELPKDKFKSERIEYLLSK